jgi:hypothetical protein
VRCMNGTAHRAVCYLLLVLLLVTGAPLVYTVQYSTASGGSGARAQTARAKATVEPLRCGGNWLANGNKLQRQRSGTFASRCQANAPH